MIRVLSWMSRLPLADRVGFGLAALVVALTALSEETRPVAGDARDLDAAALAMLAAALGLLLLRNRFPGTVVVGVLALSFAWYLSGYTSGLINVPTLVAFYSLGATGDRRRQLGIGGVALVITPIVMFAVADAASGEALDAVGYPLAALLLGELVRGRRLLLAELEQKALMAESERDAATERRVAEERVHIARDVHDVLAHAVAVMTVQAGVAADTYDRDPAAAKDALATIRSAGKDAMAEMRATVAVLRGSDPLETAPAPRLDRLAELVDGARAEGLDVDLTMDLDGDPAAATVESLVQLTAYRVVQESLTNVLRHARASQASVRIDRRPHTLTVRVADNGRSRPLPGWRPHGFGLRGMRERVESLGGTLHFGRQATGGWEVVASLPVRGPG